MSDKDILKEALACAYEYWPRVNDSLEVVREKDVRRRQMVQEGTAGWRCRLYEALKEALPGFEVIDYTDDEGDACCVGYIVLLHPDQPLLDDDEELLEALHGTRYDLEIYCSMLSPFYYMECRRTTLTQLDDGKRLTFARAASPCPAVPKKVAETLEEVGFSALSRPVILHPVPDLDVEFVPMGKTILFSCLFESLFTESVRHSGRVCEKRNGDTWYSW